MTSFNFRWKVLGAHAHIDVFAGSVAGSRGHCGTLCMREEEWHALKDKLAKHKGMEFQHDEIPPLPKPGSRIKINAEPPLYGVVTHYSLDAGKMHVRLDNDPWPRAMKLSDLESGYIEDLGRNK